MQRACFLLVVTLLAAVLSSPAAAQEADSVAIVVADSVILPPPEPILGLAVVTPDRMCRFVQLHNANFSYEVADAFYTIAARYGIRGDIMLCQAILETGWFKFMDGTAVTPDQYNFGGLGVTGAGATGNSYTSLEQGVTAMAQHLYAYACDCELPEGEELVDVRFGLVARGCATTWEALSGRWAMNPQYGQLILSIYARLQNFQ